MPYRNSPQRLEKWHTDMENLVKSRNHQLISGKMINHQREVCYIVHCSLHDHTMEVSFFNYKRSKTGCLFCGIEKVSSTFSGRQFSEETIERMTVSAYQRPDRGGRPRRWRETHSYRAWNSLVRENWNHQCAITGIQNENNSISDQPQDVNQQKLVVHHLIGVSKEDCLALVVENGILIHKDLHVAFHNKYGYRKNTVAQFLDFIQKLAKNEIIVSISNQRNPVSLPLVAENNKEGFQGSETRVYDSDKIMKLHERLKEIEIILETILFNKSSSLPFPALPCPSLPFPARTGRAGKGREGQGRVFTNVKTYFR